MSIFATEDSSGMNSGSHHSHHLNVLNIIPVDDATHVAVQDGKWSDPNTWESGTLPGEGAIVFIPNGLSVNYDVKSTVEISGVRVEGELHFATDIDTELHVETIVTGMHSYLSVGTQDNPVDENVTARIVFTDAPIDHALDPEQLGHGLVSLGEVDIHGASKTPYTTLKYPVLAGESIIMLGEDVSNWQVGDQILVVGTDGRDKTQDEIRTIRHISESGLIEVDRPFEFNHAPPEGYSDLDLYVAATTRNVILTSENPDGTRGHVMLMNGESDIRYAEFDELGRTDKSIPLDQDGKALDGGDNVASRYSLHFHETGVENDSPMAIAYGNSIHGNPGWAITHHSSTAAIDFNVVFDVQGAGIVAEDGNERGQWVGNLVTNVYGDGQPRNWERDESMGDFGHAGDAFASATRSLLQVDNIAANSITAWQFVALQTSFDLNDVSELQFDPYSTLDQVPGSEYPIVGFHGNTAIAVDTALSSGHRHIITVRHITGDILSDITDFTAWEISKQAIKFEEYTSDYVIKDTLLIGVDTNARGLSLPNKLDQTTLVNVHFENFEYGIHDAGYNYEGKYVDVTFSNVLTEIDAEFYDKTYMFETHEHPILDGDDITPIDKPFVTLKPDYVWADGRQAFDDTITPDDSRFVIHGEITDSLGSYMIGTTVWNNRTEKAANKPIEARGIANINKVGEEIPWALSKDRTEILSSEELLAYHGATQKNGEWVMELIYWITDRFTAEHTPVIIDVKLEGFDEAVLAKYEVPNKALPSGEITRIDVKTGDVLDLEDNVVGYVDLSYNKAHEGHNHGAGGEPAGSEKPPHDEHGDHEDGSLGDEGDYEEDHQHQDDGHQDEDREDEGHEGGDHEGEGQEDGDHEDESHEDEDQEGEGHEGNEGSGHGDPDGEDSPPHEETPDEDSDEGADAGSGDSIFKDPGASEDGGADQGVKDPVNDDAMQNDKGVVVTISTSASETLKGEDGTRDVFVYSVMNEDLHASGVRNADAIRKFNADEGDQVDLSALLSGFDPKQHDVHDFVRFSEIHAGTRIEVDLDGAENGANFEWLAVLIKTSDFGSVDEAVEDDVLILTADQELKDGAADDGTQYGEGVVVTQSTSSSETLKSEGGMKDAFVYSLMNEDFHASGVRNADAIRNFNADEGDLLDLSPLLAGFDPTQSDVHDFVRINEIHAGTRIEVDLDGAENGANFEWLAVLIDVKDIGPLDDLIQSGNLIV